MRRNGFTLVEVMISMALASVVLAGAFMLLSSQRTVLSQEIALQKRQQDLWVSMEFIQREFRKAGMGFGFCQSTVAGVTYKAQADCWPGAAGAPQVLRAIDFTDGGTTGSDTLTISYGTPTGDGSIDLTPSGPISTYTTTAVATPDPRAFFAPLGCTCGGTCAFPGTQLAILYNATDNTVPCTLVSVTASTCTYPAASTMTINTRPTVTCAAPAYVLPTSRAYAAGTVGPPAGGTAMLNLGPLTQATYSIDAVTDPNNPTLVRTVNGAAQVVAYGIEDLQVVVGCDVNNDGVIGIEGANAAAKASDEWFNNVAGDTTPATCTTYPQVRVTMIARTAVPDPGFTAGGRPAIENRVAGAADQFHRRVLSAVISAQNMGL